MKRIAFFNNKGGVGKTTLICNIAHYLATRKKRRVLLIDLDPQCNATQLILPAESSLGIYWTDDANTFQYNGSVPAEFVSLYDVANPLDEGDGITTPPSPLPGAENRFGVDLIPGHPKVSLLEDRLGSWFRDARGGAIEGLRRTLWLESVLKSYEDDYDVVLFDLGPSLGALNRSVLAVSDHFVTPMGADIFSVVAIRTISEWIQDWATKFETGVAVCDNPASLAKHEIPSELRIRKGFAGYTVQQYSTVTVRGERRATVAYEQIIKGIPSQVQKHLLDFASDGLSEEALNLGDVPNLRSLVPLAQTSNAPLSSLTAKDGLAGGQYSQQKDYRKLIHTVADRLDRNCLS